jgi:hypothetical protein
MMLPVAGYRVEQSSAGELGFLEKFALAPDRSIPLAELIPGTEDYFYYHCLHYQQVEQYQRVEELLPRWIERFGITPGVVEIRHRQALLTYEDNPDKSLAYVIETLNLQFNHQRETVDQSAELATQLDSSLIDRQRLLQQSLQSYRNLNGIEDSGLPKLLGAELTTEQRRELLQRLNRPDLDGLLDVIVADLQGRDAIPFGTYELHRQLLRSQLDALLQRVPSLLNEMNFVTTYLHKLAPPPGTDLQYDLESRKQYLDTLWPFVTRLSEVHNSLKAHVLYHRLQLDLQTGDLSKERLLTYLKLPRPVHYINPRYAQAPENRNAMANLNEDFGQATQLTAIGNDDAVVRPYLQHFLRDARDYREFQAYISDQYLKELFAETKIVNGLGDAERWSSLLTPAQYQALRDRIDLDFAPTNPQTFGSDQSIALDVFIKNVPKLIVKVYRINALNYYQDQSQHISTDINLDGLVANLEQTHEYKESPFLRVRHRFTFPQLETPGIYVVDFIGSGKSSRVLIHKGRLSHLEQRTAAGHVFTVLDDKQQPLADAKIWMAGKFYDADNHGDILIPFSTNPGIQPIVLMHGSLAGLAHFQHQQEQYQLEAGFHVPREALRDRRIAPLVISTRLRLNDVPVSCELLEDVTLTITATDREDSRTTTVVRDVELTDDRDYVYEFRVPPRLRHLSFSLHAKVKQLTTGEMRDVIAGDQISINEIISKHAIESVFLSRDTTGYQLEVLGKTGEPKARRPIHLTLKHRDFRDLVNVTLRTDEAGRVQLGRLPGITMVAVAGKDELPTASWELDEDHYRHHPVIHAREGELIEVPYHGTTTDVTDQSFSLLELRGGLYAVSHREQMSVDKNTVRLKNLAAGEYRLMMHDTQTTVYIRVAKGEATRGHVVDGMRVLELSNTSPVHLAEVARDGTQVTVRVAHATPSTRVHVVANRFQPHRDAYGQLNRFTLSSLGIREQLRLPTFYVQGRQLGDEYRYILDRKYAAKYPGNMLDRPELLLNPWAVRDTATEQEQLEQGGEFASDAPAAAVPNSLAGEGAAADESTGEFSDLNFLAGDTLIAFNLKPDASGNVSVDLKELHGERMVYIVVVDLDRIEQRVLELPASDRPQLDLRLADGLDPQQHFALEKQIAIAQANEQLQIDNLGSGRFQLFDSLQQVFDFYRTMMPHENLSEFDFIVRWPKLSDDEKHDYYSRYACHELHFFLAQKDPAFFDTVVRPYLANKLHKTFLDHYLLNDDLSVYRSPWYYEQLNTFEKILLGKRIAAEQSETRRWLESQWALIPVDQDRLNHLFDAALLGDALSAEARGGIAGNLGGMGGGERYDFFAGGAVNAPSSRPERGSMGRRFAGENSAMFDSAQPPTPGQDSEGLAMEARSAAAKQLSLGARMGVDRLRRGVELREQVAEKQLYQTLDQTKEWAENNYYHLPIEADTADRVTVNDFWIDWAKHDGDGPFRSTHFAQASHNLTEAILALALTDLPFDKPEHDYKVVDQAIQIRTASPAIVFREGIRSAEALKEAAPILVSQNFYRYGERTQMVDGREVDRFITDEFLVGTIYGCHLVVTNPTSSEQKLDILTQIPVGALPVTSGKATESHRVQLQPYATTTVEYFFYFPASGDFPHFPVHVTQDGEVVATGSAFAFHVVNELSKLDRESWAYVSQQGTDADVIEYLQTKNLHAIDLARIAHRMSSAEFFDKTIDVLRKRHGYDHTLWSYAVKHNRPAAIEEFLRHEAAIAAQSGLVLRSPLLTIDPVVRDMYQHLEYHPLVNARAHQVGKQRQILNDRLFTQYQQWLQLLSYERIPTDQQRLQSVYYLLVQDRMAEAMEQFQQVNRERIYTALQYDYCHAYLSMSQGDPETALSIATRYDNYPVDRWQEAFAVVKRHVAEIQGSPGDSFNEEDRNQRIDKLAADSSSFNFEVDGQQIKLRYQNLKNVTIHYYQMDIELLFSRNPFVQQHGRQFAYIAPNLSESLELDATQGSVAHRLPESLRNQNVLVEIEAGGQRRSQPIFSNSLNIQLNDNYGQLRVMHADSGQVLPKVYCKVYARLHDGSVVFYKDGYTDLRGRFDYATLSTNLLDQVQRFSLLVLSEENGASVQEVGLPKR